MEIQGKKELDSNVDLRLPAIRAFCSGNRDVEPVAGGTSGSAGMVELKQIERADMLAVRIRAETNEHGLLGSNGPDSGYDPGSEAGRIQRALSVLRLDLEHVTHGRSRAHDKAMEARMNR